MVLSRNPEKIVGFFEGTRTHVKSKDDGRGPSVVRKITNERKDRVKDRNI